MSVRYGRPEALLLAALYVGTTFIAASYAIPDPAAYYLPAVMVTALAAGVGA